ncbi:MAG TPA: hypothetical protein VG603_05145 [Chitinophagales bacterium]|nr:hypothetical protein [Chitinophagales bacterium]
MKQYGLIGYPLTHSFSKKYFEEKFTRENISGSSYGLFPISDIHQFPQLLNNNPGLCGLNVTIPYKEAVIPYLNEMDTAAIETGAVNCIKINGGRLKGYNTDIYGFEISLKHFLAHKPEQAFVLGSGGSAKAIVYVLKKLSLPYVQVSRQRVLGFLSYSQIESYLQPSNLFINCTPLGMFPEVNACPGIPYQKLSKSDYLFDLVYNPVQTLFLKKGAEMGANIKNGEEMLAVQAEKSWEIWYTG